MRPREYENIASELTLGAGGGAGVRSSRPRGGRVARQPSSKQSKRKNYVMYNYYGSHRRAPCVCGGRQASRDLHRFSSL